MKNHQQHVHKLITALFRDHHDAGKAFNIALKLGYKKHEINILMSEETKKKTGQDKNSLNDEAIKGAGVGGSLGVTTGAITGAIMAVGAFVVISGLGLAISGPLAVALAGAGAGGVAGGLVGALINIGISQDQAENCATDIKNGGVLICLTPHYQEDSKILETEWKNYGGIVLTSKPSQ